ncbi:MarR family winged helix-turn-helix transcriptional regulator [Halomonas sp. IOP_6]|uniref:MarR family winged helix-turn-helix transcriptional regulator n=1 Tax=Halomonas sp. IOP_6 TaxID=2876583 RepID=UPI001E347AF3|nr:MarR family winged helix-turn-helix transcriptional regulator [Halomonas sp. IOP_6]MCD6005080.1 MarR family winged helix-turn-helix transcriptional regulator [Halomonas sp. IOP_6]
MQRVWDIVEEFRKLESDLPVKVAYLFAYIAANPGISISELQKQTNIEQSTCSRSVAVLSEWQTAEKPGLGLVWTEEDPEERRRKLAYLTEKGEKLAATLANMLR